MAIEKTSTVAGTSALAPLTSVPRTPDNLARIGAGTLDVLIGLEQREAVAAAKQIAAKTNARKRTRIVRSGDIEAVRSRLTNASMTIAAIHHLSLRADDEDGWAYLIAIQEMARSTGIAMDASIAQLGGHGFGHFNQDFAKA